MSKINLSPQNDVKTVDNKPVVKTNKQESEVLHVDETNEDDLFSEPKPQVINILCASEEKTSSNHECLSVNFGSYQLTREIAKT